MNRIEAAFRVKRGPALIGYLMAGHPSIDKTPALVKAMAGGGADIVEIGIPYSDPLADGPVIQEAGQAALMQGVTVDSVFSMIPEINRLTDVPLILMVYFSTIYRYGADRFITECKSAKISGLIIPDLSLEEREEIQAALLDSGIALIPLVAPTSKERIKKIVTGAEGFVYCVSSLGVTGQNGQFHQDIEAYLKNVREATGLPIAVGFGISSHYDVQRLAPYVDGVIVGTALVKTISESNGDPEALKAKVKSLKGL